MGSAAVMGANIVELYQVGFGNNSDIKQYGSNNIAESTIDGNSTSSTIVQDGNGNEVVQDLIGNELSYILTQDGNNNAITQTENSSVDTSIPKYDITQIGNSMRIIIINGIAE